MILDEHMALRDQRDQDVAQRALGDLHRERDVLGDACAQRRHIRGIELTGPVHLGAILRPGSHRAGRLFAQRFDAEVAALKLGVRRQLL